MAREVFPTLHSYVGVSTPSSISVAAAEQVNVVPVKTPVLGLITAGLEKVGDVLMTVSVVVLCPIPPLESVAVTVQRRTSVGDIDVVDRFKVALLVVLLVAV